MTHLTVHAFPAPDVERAWRAGLAQIEVPSHYNAPEFFLDPLLRGNRFAILALDGEAVVGILTGAHLGAEVVCGHQSRPQVCFSKSAGAAATEAMARGLIGEGDGAKLLTVYAWTSTPLTAFERHGFRSRQLEGDVVLDLTQGSEAILRQLNVKAREGVRRAMKTGVEVFQATTREDVLAYYRVQSKWKESSRKKIVYPDFSWEQFEQRYCQRNNIRLFLARYKGEVIAGNTVRFFPGGLIEAANNASREEFLHLRPNDLLMWKVIEWACAQGFPQFSLGGAHPFLRKFGGTVVPIQRYRVDRTWMRRHDLREGLLDFGREKLSKLPAPVENAVRRLVGKDR